MIRFGHLEFCLVTIFHSLYNLLSGYSDYEGFIRMYVSEKVIGHHA